MNIKTYGLIGYPLIHSFSRAYFSDKFKREKIDAQYCNFEIEDISKIKDIIYGQKDICGLNVTIPHKRDVMCFLDELDNEAEVIGAVNVIKITRDAAGNVHTKGYNTDTIGFCSSIVPLLSPWNNKALVLGTGGVSKAIIYSLEKLGIQTLPVSREKRKGVITYHELDETILNSYTIIVNASPVGMFPNIEAAPQIPYQYITNKHIVFDTIYNPTETKLMKLSAKQGATVKNGLEMLEGQAVAAWKIWNS